MVTFLSPFVLFLLFPSVQPYTAYHKVWPACRVELYTESSDILRTLTVSDDFIFDYSGHWHTVVHILEAGRVSFIRSANRLPRYASDFPANPEKKALWPITGIHIHISTNDTILHHNVNETYALEIRPVIDNDSFILLTAPTVYGALHGLQTLSQLVEFGWLDSSDPSNAVHIIQDTPLIIIDGPEYPYRGLLVDTSRHFLPFDLLLSNLDAMAMNKMNVLHWHMTDSQSWPFQSLTYPELSEKASYCRDCVYTAHDVKEIQRQAAVRGIRVIPEFDLPGHSQAIGLAYPLLLTNCSEKGFMEPLDVTNRGVLEFTRRLYGEISSLFLDEMVHLGGDEVSFDCWKASKKIQDWMKQNNMTDEWQLQQYFEIFLYKIARDLNKRSLVWQEVYDNAHDALPRDVIVDVWKLPDDGSRQNATRDGHHVIYSACWYLDHLDDDWAKYYQCDPRDFNGTTQQKQRMIGGHASMWGERVDETIFSPCVWPRASAAAEKLWTGNSVLARESSFERLQIFRCRMLRMGIDAAPIAPGTCDSTVY